MLELNSDWVLEHVAPCEVGFVGFLCVAGVHEFIDWWGALAAH